MAAADSMHVIACPNCKARFEVAAALAGRRARCAACSAAFTVPSLDGEPTPASKEPPQPQKQPEKAPAEREFVSFECRVCGTRLTSYADRVGRKVKCPDCGAGTPVPEPPKPKAPNMPAALEGDQYELWDPDDQPLPSEIIASQSRYVAINCRTCGTLMQAAEAQVGQHIACPDCGTKHIVPRIVDDIANIDVLAPDSLTPQLDFDAPVAPRPVLVPHTLGLSLAEQEHQAEVERDRERAKRTGKAAKFDSRGRPVMPRFPLLTGILPFPFSAGCPTRWVTLTVGMLAWGFLALDGIPAWVNWNMGGGGAIGAMGGLVETLLAAVGVVIWAGALSSIVIAIITQSAVGSDRVDEWPSLNFIHSMGEMLPLVVAIVFAAAPGWILAQLFANDPALTAAMTFGSLILFLPMVLLSQQAGSSTWELVDVPVLGAMLRSPFSMMLIYIESALLLIMCAAACIYGYQVHGYLPLLAAPLIVACILVYARLVGRLGFRLTEKIVIEVPDEEPAPVGSKNYNPPRPSRRAT
jgi:predicted Zn finger-like uncharacterized protein